MSALQRNDVEAAIALFEPDCYWRDLVAFTWNIRTQEGPEAIRAMLKARLAETRPTAFAVEGEASEAGGVVEAWFTFETEGSPRPRPRALAQREGVDTADDDDRAQGL
jgi:putative flavoprotein involved in K+ transport